MTTHRYDPDYVVHPGATLEEWLNHNQLPRRVCRLYNIELDELAGIIDGTVHIDEDVARRLAQFTLISKEFWLAMEHNFRAGLKAGLSWIK